MKKILLLVVFFFFSFSYFQDYEIIYKSVYNKEWKHQLTKIAFDEELSEIQVTNLESGFKRTLSRVSDLEDYETESGFKLFQAYYSDEITKSLSCVQIFKDKKFGIRIIYGSVESFQYAEFLSEE